jgi:hypothetical protein
MLSATDETTQQPITYQNSPSGYAPGTEVSFVTEEGGSIFLQSSTNSSYPAVPAAMLQGNAYYESVSIAGDVDATWVSFTRNWNSGGGPLTVIFPSVWTYSGPAAAALPVFNFSTYTGFTGTTGIARVVRETWGTGANTGSSYQVTASANFQDGAETVATPDLSGLSGFLAVPLSGTTVSWVAYINQNSAGAIAATPEDTPTNSSTETVQDAGRFVVP